MGAGSPGSWLRAQDRGTPSGCVSGERWAVLAPARTIAASCRPISRGRHLIASTKMERWNVGKLECMVIVFLSIIPSFQLSAQGVLNQFSYDNLRFSGIQVDAGPLASSQLTGTIAAGLRIDYGMIAPHVRVLLGLSYFRSQFDNQTRARFEERIATLVNDPDSNFTIDIGRIFWSDIVADVDLQYQIPQGPGITTYIGVGASAHLRNGSGTSMTGTVVEDAIGAVTGRFNATIGDEFAITSAWRFTIDGRGV